MAIAGLKRFGVHTGDALGAPIQDKALASGGGGFGGLAVVGLGSPERPIGERAIRRKPAAALTYARPIDISIIIEIKITGNHHALSKALRALANPNRLAIFERIHDDGLCCRTNRKGNTVCAIAEDFRLALSTVSHHLKQLRAAGLITCERRGQQILCTINYDTLERVLALLGGTAQRTRRHSARRP